MDFEIEIFNKRDIESVYKLFTNVYKSDDIIFIEKNKMVVYIQNSFALVVKNDNNQIIANVMIKWPLKIKIKLRHINFVEHVFIKIIEGWVFFF